MDQNTVLSVSGDRDSLLERELALRTCGFKVVSVESESQARHEIEIAGCRVQMEDHPATESPASPIGVALRSSTIVDHPARNPGGK